MAVPDIALHKNTSAAISAVAFRFPWRAGDNLVLAAVEFSSNRVARHTLARLAVKCPVAYLTGAGDPERPVLGRISSRTRGLTAPDQLLSPRIQSKRNRRSGSASSGDG